MEIMPFGLCNAPSTFQRLMESVLYMVCLERFCVAYMDDILVLGFTFEEHLKNMADVFDQLQVAGLRLKSSKCHLAKLEVRYLDYVVSGKSQSHH